MSGGKLPISFTDYERFRGICYLSFIKWLLFVAGVTRAKESCASALNSPVPIYTPEWRDAL